MGVWVLYDNEAERAVLYNSREEVPIPGVAWIGGDAREWAESFCAYLGTRHNARQGHDRTAPTFRLTDPRTYATDDLEVTVERHAELVGDPGTGELNEYGVALYEWLWAGPAHTPANAPFYKPVPEPEDVPERA